MDVVVVAAGTDGTGGTVVVVGLGISTGLGAYLGGSGFCRKRRAVP